MTRRNFGARRRMMPNRLWKYRRRMGFTQTQVAAILGYLPSTSLSQYERGRRLPRLETALKLEIVYRIPIAALYPELYQELKAELRSREERLRLEWNRPCHDAAR